MMETMQIRVFIPVDDKALNTYQKLVDVLAEAGYDLHIGCNHYPEDGEAVVQTLMSADEGTQLH